jgi:hypothetical protein
MLGESIVGQAFVLIDIFSSVVGFNPMLSVMRMGPFQFRDELEGRLGAVT